MQVVHIHFRQPHSYSKANEERLLHEITFPPSRTPPMSQCYPRLVCSMYAIPNAPFRSCLVSNPYASGMLCKYCLLLLCPIPVVCFLCLVACSISSSSPSHISAYIPCCLGDLYLIHDADGEVLWLEMGRGTM